MKQYLNSLFLLFLAFVAFSCTENRYYEENIDFSDRIWQMNETASFTFNIDDDSSYYELYLNLRNDVQYPYRNIYVHYTLQDSTDRELEKELQNIQLFDPKTGEPFGSGVSSIYSHQVLLKDSVLFPREGRYTIALKQYMRTDSLQGVYSVGLRIDKQSSSVNP
ncbi:gliding motility lipoprotein GldH [Marivirga lumbricoides]|uniref:Gliding motility lipoprotein GldH n=1 Tax=Marivirga lumbricoides TaxID=1046115 RepID=A0A2T4DS32_9BACT|nr:gliding motility lipoprotein GldH [Marivirga lumbricoides]GGC42774.1 gliding motility lipoprotein GldH [Marivirga lumbricoides]